jgi:hypothetical protein
LYISIINLHIIKISKNNRYHRNSIFHIPYMLTVITVTP